MSTGQPTGGESFDNPGSRTRGLRARHRVTLLVAAAGLVVGSVVAVAAPAAAAKTAVVHSTVLGKAGSSHVQRITLKLHGRTGSIAAAAATKAVSLAMPHKALPSLGAGRRTKAAARTVPVISPFPTVSCAPVGPGCDAISGSGGAKSNRNGLAATANGGLFGEDIEPPDQGLCAGNGFVLESINIGEIRVFNAKLAPVSGITSLDSLMGLTAQGWSSGGDIMCEYDGGNGGHWFISEIVSTTSSPFTGCFLGITNGCLEGIAVSSNNNPLSSSWNTYLLDPNQVSPTAPGAGHLMNDYGKMGMTRDAFLFFYDEFNLSGTLPTCPSYGCDQFNGAQEFAFQKSAMELGFPNVNAVHENMGTDPFIQPPDGNCFNGSTAGVTCWYQVIPANSASGQFDNKYGGTGFMAATLDFNSFTFGNGPGDNRAAAFYWTGLSALNSLGCGACNNISFGGQLFTGLESYIDSGQGCPASAGNPCGLAAQRFGTIPLGANCGALGLAGVPSCPEAGLATNGDGVTQASYAGGQIWLAANTLINETFGTSSEIHMGAAYFVIGTSSFVGGSHLLTLTSQGYVAASHEDLAFPDLVGGSASEGALMSFTLSGNGGPTAADGGGFFPSSAYGRVTTGSGGLVGSTINVTALGAAPQDGFSEYQGLPGPIRPRWGDYGAAVFLPGKGFYFASEMIQFPNCSPAYFLNVDPTCGGTRDPYANFGTSINWAH
jgi:hypothetical protein